MFLYICNWKMNMSFEQALLFCQVNFDGFVNLSKLQDKKIVLCPEFTHIKSVMDGFSDLLDNNFAIGAQDCSEHLSGPYTGQVSAKSLDQIGCDYCIVGHSEQRKYCSQANKAVAGKVGCLFESGLTPIVCIGESKQDFDTDRAKEILRGQLELILQVVKAHESENSKGFCIAYEPIWSIGTGIIPKNSYIQDIFNFIKSIIKEYGIKTKISLLYGGSVNCDNVSDLKLIDSLEGFLIGGASLDFKKFEKIVQL